MQTKHTQNGGSAPIQSDKSISNITLTRPDFNTGTIYLYSEVRDFVEEEVSITTSKDVDGIHIAVAFEITPLLGITLNSDEAQALIANLQAALNAHWGNV